MTTKKNQVPAERKDTLPAVYDYGEDAGAGFEDFGREDVAIPFLYVLQSNSPELDTLDGAKAGMLLNTVTQQLYDGKEGVVFIPCHRQHVFTEWVPREQGGGFQGMHEPGDDVVIRAKEDAAEFGKYRTREGNDLVETFYVFGLIVNEDGAAPAVAPFSSTKIKKYRQWMAVATGVKLRLDDGRVVQPPMFAHRYRLRTVQEENKKGKYHNLAISFDGGNAAEARLSPSDGLYQEAKAFREIAAAGRVKTDPGQAKREEEVDDEIPF